MSRSVLAFVAVLLLPIGASTAPVPAHLMPEFIADDYPTRVGASWHYREADRRSSMTIVKVTEKEGTKVLTRFGVSGGCGSGRAAVMVSATRVTVVGIGPQSAPRTLLVLPLRIGTTWEDQGWTATVKRREKVKVPAGEYDAIRVEETSRSADGEVKVTRWYARGVGFVKRTRRAPDGRETEMVLQSFRPGRK